ncbi:hypothetical protein CPB85DRAFT_1027131 [Mucidula mucida]|nr:hypothetical protein CPB85DRAFT_1027131 [Mucidula mucida]
MAFFKRLFFFLTIYPDVQRALQDPQYIPQLMKKLSESRNITLLIQSTFFGAYIQTGRTCDAAWTAAVVLLTIHISFLYNNMSSEVFEQRVTLIGPIVFTIFHTIPNVLLWILIVQEIIRSTPNAGVGVVFALLACIPLVFHIVWFEVIAYMQDGGSDEPHSVGTVDNTTSTST